MKPFTEDSLTRALDHHVKTGAVREYRRSPDRLNRWIVDLPGYGTATLTTDQLYGLTLGLAAGQRHWKDDSRTATIVDAALEMMTAEAVRIEEDEETPPPFSSVEIDAVRARKRVA